MSVTSKIRKAGPYTGNGITTSYPFTFKVFNTSEVLVVQTDATGNEARLTLTVDYTVTLNADQDANPGGTVDMLVAPAVGLLITLTSSVDETQSVTLTNQGGFYPTVINDALDRLTIITQQILESLGRKIGYGVSDTTTGVVPAASERANKFLAFDSNGQVVASAVSVGTIPSSIVSDVVTMRAGSVTNGEIVDLKYHTTSNAGGGGRFRGVTGVAPGTYVDNNGTIIVPTGSDGSAAWLRDDIGYVTPEMFGAIGDGVTDDTSALNDAFSALSDNSTIIFSRKTYTSHNLAAITSRNGITIEGNGATIKADAATAAGYCLEFITCDNVIVRGIIFDRQNSYRAGVQLNGINFNDSTNCTAEYNDFSECYYGVLAGGTTLCDKITVQHNRTVGRLSYSAANVTDFLLPMFMFYGLTGKGNHIFANNYCEKSTHMVQFVSGPHSKVTGNTSINGHNSQIYMADDYCQAIGNYVENAGKDGIKINHASALVPVNHCIVSDNIVIGGGVTQTDGGQCINVVGHHNVISNNVLVLLP